MDRKKVASEILKVAQEILAMEFPTDESLKKYLKDHPAADKSKHKVVKPKPEKPQGKSNLFDKEVTPENHKNYVKGLNKLKKMYDKKSPKSPDTLAEDTDDVGGWMGEVGPEFSMAREDGGVSDNGKIEKHSYESASKHLAGMIHVMGAKKVKRGLLGLAKNNLEYFKDDPSDKGYIDNAKRFLGLSKMVKEHKNNPHIQKELAAIKAHS